LLAHHTQASEAHALVPLPWRSAAPELLACVMVTLAALVLAYIGLRRSVTIDERARALQHQLAAEREARCRLDQALADNDDVLYRLVRQHERVREGERTRIGRELQAELGRRLSSLRDEMAGLRECAGSTPAPVLLARVDCALAGIDGAIHAVRAVAGGLRSANPGDGLRQALERCLAEHAHRHGLRYRFEAGVEPSSRASQDRAARLAVFRVLQDVLAGAARRAGNAGDAHDCELHVRLLEGAGTLGLEVDGCAGSADDVSTLPVELVEHIRAMGGVLRMVATAERRARWSLSVPLRAAVQDPVRDALQETVSSLPVSVARVA
jgi:signal transduction histidine kinase